MTTTRVVLTALLLEFKWNIQALADHLGMHKASLYRRIHWHEITRPPEFQKGHLYRTQTHCKRGHPFTNKNTYITKQGWRRCRRCDAIRRKPHEQKGSLLSNGSHVSDSVGLSTGTQD
jgi:hypothetical protein